MRASEDESHEIGESNPKIEFHTVPWDLILESHSQVLNHLRNHHEIDVLNTTIVTILVRSQCSDLFMGFNVEVSNSNFEGKCIK